MTYYRDMDTVNENIRFTQEQEDEPTLVEALKELIDFIEENNITDEGANNGDGYANTWRSDEFDLVLNRAKKAVKKEDDI